MYNSETMFRMETENFHLRFPLNFLVSCILCAPGQSSSHYCFSSTTWLLYLCIVFWAFFGIIFCLAPDLKHLRTIIDQLKIIFCWIRPQSDALLLLLRDAIFFRVALWFLVFICPVSPKCKSFYVSLNSCWGIRNELNIFIQFSFTVDLERRWKVCWGKINDKTVCHSSSNVEKQWDWEEQKRNSWSHQSHE